MHYNGVRISHDPPAVFFDTKLQVAVFSVSDPEALVEAVDAFEDGPAAKRIAGDEARPL